MRPLLLCLPLLLAACPKPQARRLDVNGPTLSGAMILRAPGAPGARDAGEPASLLFVDLKAGVTLGDAPLAGASLQGTQLQAPGHSGFGFSGAVVQGTASDGAPVRLRIDGITQALDPTPATPANENEDVYLYSLSYERGGAWEPLCPGENRALPAAGRWDPKRGRPGDGAKVSSLGTEVTFACEGSAIAKCIVRHGYRPWKDATHEALHQACVRAVRADYCGTGDSLTREGEIVNYYDSLGLQKDTAEWAFEAEWTPAGARCVSGTRLETAPGLPPDMTVEKYIRQTCPQVWKPTCAASQAAGPAMQTEYRRP